MDRYIPAQLGALARVSHAGDHVLPVGLWLGIGWLATLGGYVGILTRLLAMYVSFAEVTNWSFGGTPFGGSETSAETAD